MTEKTIFKKIIDGEIPADIVYEDEQSLAFRDVSPQAPTHILIIPRKEIASIDDLTEEDEQLVGHLFIVAQKLAKQENLTEGYRTLINCGPAGGQTVFHLHLHLMGGRNLTWPPG
ncbi:MAG: histidine triad nucleotide-binding protein [Planctomycetaceae bacterium]